MHPAEQTDECMELAERGPVPSYYFTIMSRHSRGMTADNQAQAPADGGVCRRGRHRQLCGHVMAVLQGERSEVVTHRKALLCFPLQRAPTCGEGEALTSRHSATGLIFLLTSLLLTLAPPIEVNVHSQLPRPIQSTHTRRGRVAAADPPDPREGPTLTWRDTHTSSQPQADRRQTSPLRDAGVFGPSSPSSPSAYVPMLPRSSCAPSPIAADRHLFV
ncbi:unnamed protein product [Pleuronectes platessa]|uniref:Uncharacterized protein n=1 Tax=Pleuronectes platessa TaxID=8262 RepID=A0A9N7W236_PLEPL|nr:unnamed protein product [Pleuronectes platessa]